jgi:NCAIR mutase (PurE)-related protein
MTGRAAAATPPGVAVVNIDNGYGAGHLAAQIAAPAEAPGLGRACLD